MIPKGGTIPWSAPDAFMRRCLPLLLWAAVSVGGCGGSPMASIHDAGVSGPPQPATFLCQPRPDTCPAGTRCWFSCASTPGFQCMTGDIGSVEYGGVCSTAADCIAGSVCTTFRPLDGGIPVTGICTAYCNTDSDCPFGEPCGSVVFRCPSGDRFTFNQCM